MLCVWFLFPSSFIFSFEIHGKNIYISYKYQHYLDDARRNKKFNYGHFGFMSTIKPWDTTFDSTEFCIDSMIYYTHVWSTLNWFVDMNGQTFISKKLLNYSCGIWSIWFIQEILCIGYLIYSIAQLGLSQYIVNVFNSEPIWHEIKFLSVVNVSTDALMY